MQKRIGVLWLGFLGILLPLAAHSASPSPASEGQTLVIVLKNGKQQSFAMTEVARIEFQGSGNTAAAAPGDLPGRGHFLGKWALGTGNGNDFYVTLEANGDASKSIGSVHHGTWTVVNGEAHITWDEGSYDAIRRVGSKWEKFWYPDASFSGKPNNVTGAEHIESKPI
jgi:hypothetical protein